MSFQRYPSYKDSGVEWLGKVPEHWHFARIKQNTYLKGRVGWKGLTSDEYLEDGYAYLITGTDFSQRYIEWGECHYVEKGRYEDDPFIQLRNGDLLITKDGTIGKLALVADVDKPACLNSGIFLIRPLRDYIPEFMFWVLSSDSFRVFCDLSSMGSTIQHLYQNVFENFLFSFPDCKEQREIVAFLDRETEKIDLLIEEQRRLIDILKEKRQAVISHAVTKGLNGDAFMKTSNDDLLGDVPAHWQVKRLKYVSPQITVGIVVEPSKHYVEEGVPALRSLNIRPGKISSADLVYISEDSNRILSKSMLRAGDVVAVRTGQPGTAAVVPTELDGCNCIDLIIIRKPIEGDERFLCWFLASDHALQQFSEGSGGAIQQHFNIAAAMNLVVTVPPVNEQIAIAKFLDDETSSINMLIADSQRAIDLLQERRSALISAAVTGKIDVRQTVAECVA